MRTVCMLIFIAAIGCTDKPSPVAKPGSGSVGSAASKEDQEVAAERAKLSPEDRALVEAQEWCVVSNDERLGSMGAPIKLMIKDQPVFICCAGCRKKAEADPDATLKKVGELKAKKAAEKRQRR